MKQILHIKKSLNKMTKDIDKYELIERYLTGQLSAEELTKLEYRMKSDPEFAREVDKHRAVSSIIRDGMLLEIREKVKAIHNSKTSYNRFRNSGNRIIALSVVGLLIFLSIMFIRNIKKDSNSKLPEEQANPVTDTSIRKDQRTDTFHDESSQINREKTTPTAHENVYKKPPTPIIEKTSNTHEIDTIRENEKINVRSEKPAKKMQVPDSTGITPELIPVTDDNKSRIDHGKDSTDCSQVAISARIETEESCEQRPTGRICIVKTSIQGGTPPYSVSIDNGKNFYPSFVFEKLYPGNYVLWLKDKYNCMTKTGNYRISSVDCDYDFIFAPDEGELWEAPSYDDAGFLKIYSKQGKLVFTKRIDYGETYMWNGLSLTDNPLPMGVYRFILELDNHDPVVGNVTIVR